jgi:dephospho-CoA kinase
MLRVALTGGIASGKSCVLSRFAALGVPTVDADSLVHEALAAGSPAVPRITARFGHGVLAADGSVDRKSLAALVFSDASARADLEAILHPEVFRRIDEWFAALPGNLASTSEVAARRSTTSPRPEQVEGRTAGSADPASDTAPQPDDAGDAPRFAIADIPLLFETRHDGLFDRIVVTTCDPQEQLRRLTQRDGLSDKEARQRLAAQWPIDEKAQRAHYVIDTGGTFEETNKQVDRVLAQLRADAGSQQD